MKRKILFIDDKNNPKINVKHGEISNVLITDIKDGVPYTHFSWIVTEILGQNLKPSRIKLSENAEYIEFMTGKYELNIDIVHKYEYFFVKTELPYKLNEIYIGKYTDMGIILKFKKI